MRGTFSGNNMRAAFPVDGLAKQLIDCLLVSFNWIIEKSNITLIQGITTGSNVYGLQKVLVVVIRLDFIIGSHLKAPIEIQNATTRL